MKPEAHDEHLILSSKRLCIASLLEMPLFQAAGEFVLNDTLLSTADSTSRLVSKRKPALVDGNLRENNL